VLSVFITAFLSILVIFVAPAYAQNQTQSQEFVTWNDPQGDFSSNSSAFKEPKQCHVLQDAVERLACYDEGTQTTPLSPQAQTGNTTNSAEDFSTDTFYRNLRDCSVLGDLILEAQCNRVKADELKESLGPGILVENPENLTVDDIPANITGESREIVEALCTSTPHTCAADIERYTPRPPIEYEDEADQDNDNGDNDNDNGNGND
jgi:hypothetical protein